MKTPAGSPGAPAGRRPRSPVPISASLLRAWPLPQPDDKAGKTGNAGNATKEGKDSRGSVLVVGGSREVPGAVILAAVAALRAGAGRLQIAIGRDVAPLVAVAVPEARVIGLRQSTDGELQERSCRALRGDVKGCDALLVGPGMAGRGAAAASELLRWCVKAEAQAARALIVDAGALRAFDGRNTFARGCALPVILTPHAGEMATLWGVSREQVLAAPLAIATRAASHLGAVVILKGAHTYVAAPDGRVFHNEAGNPGLGTSGSGDVLAGIVAGLCARRADPVQAAVWAVFLHAQAGEALAREIGDLGFLARELSSEIPRLLSRLAVPQKQRRPRPLHQILGARASGSRG